MRALVYCSNCGEKLSGALKFCSSCGYKISDDELTQMETLRRSDEKPKDAGNFVTDDDETSDSMDIDEEYIKPAEIIDRPDYDEIPKPPGATVKTKVPQSTRCSQCGIKTDDICFFCDYAVCNSHSVKMQICTDTGRFGNIIHSCPDCAGRKNGRQPTEDEAAENGFFFKIKPYHEWKIVD